MKLLSHSISQACAGSMLICMLLLAGCVGNKEVPEPEDLIAETNYIDLLVEMQHIVTYRNSEPDSVNADSLKQLVFIRYGVTEDQFLNSHEYYQSQVSEQLIRVDEAIRQLDMEQQYIQAHIDSVKAERKAEALKEAETDSL